MSAFAPASHTFGAELRTATRPQSVGSPASRSSRIIDRAQIADTQVAPPPSRVGEVRDGGAYNTDKPTRRPLAEGVRAARSGDVQGLRVIRKVALRRVGGRGRSAPRLVLGADAAALDARGVRTRRLVELRRHGRVEALA